MKINPFLTAIAKKYNGKIEYVAFCRLEKGQFGEAARRKSIEEYRILIDEDKFICPFQIFKVFFHELGHIVLSHFGFRYFMTYPGDKIKDEKEADMWAFGRMGITDERGRIKEKHEICHRCIIENSQRCLKKIADDGEMV